MANIVVGAQAKYLGNRIIDGALSYDLVKSKRPDLIEQIDYHLIQQGREDLITGYVPPVVEPSEPEEDKKPTETPEGNEVAPEEPKDEVEDKPTTLPETDEEAKEEVEQSKDEPTTIPEIEDTKDTTEVSPKISKKRLK